MTPAHGTTVIDFAELLRAHEAKDETRFKAIEAEQEKLLASSLRIEKTTTAIKVYLGKIAKGGAGLFAIVEVIRSFL